MPKRKIKVEEDILSKNDKRAATLRKKFDESSTLVLNLMASPGAGKTSIIMRTLKEFKNKVKIAVIDGDVVETDVERIRNVNVPVALANTGGACHLDAVMIEKALKKIDLEEIELLIIENVGNLICPANFDLGAHQNVVISSVPEGDDKPYKYPGMFKGADVLLLNKVDYLQLEKFNVDHFRKGVERLNPQLTFFPVSCRTDAGFDKWFHWIKAQLD